MRDLIISSIKQLIELLRERGVTIDTKCLNYKRKKVPLNPLNDCCQEVKTRSKQFVVEDNLDIQPNCSKVIHRQDSVEEIDQMLTKDEIYSSIVLSLIHVK